MQFIDSHSHLNSDAFDEDRDEVIARMKAAGMAAAMVIACEDDELPKLEALLAEHPGWLFGAWALHPEFPDKPEPTVERIAEICSRPGFAAVGETGLDFYWCKEPLDWQRARFRRHIEAAKAIGKPLIIHARDSEREALEILRDMHAGIGDGIALAVRHADLRKPLAVRLDIGRNRFVEEYLLILKLIQNLSSFVHDNTLPFISMTCRRR